MKYDFPWKEGDIVPIFKDYQKELEYIGAAKLVSFHGFGRSFILEEVMPETDQKVYSYQEWITTLDDNKPYKIRYLDAIGITNSKSDEEYDEEDSKLLIDSFIEVNGIQVY